MVRKKIAPAGGHAKDIATSWARERPDLDPLDYLLSIYLFASAKSLIASEASVGTDIRAKRRGDTRPAGAAPRWRRLCHAANRPVPRLAGHLGRDHEESGSDVGSRTGQADQQGRTSVQLTTKGKQVADKTMTEIARSSLLSRRRVSLSSQERKVLATLCEKLLLDFEADVGVLELIE